MASLGSAVFVYLSAPPYRPGVGAFRNTVCWPTNYKSCYLWSLEFAGVVNIHEPGEVESLYSFSPDTVEHSSSRIVHPIIALTPHARDFYAGWTEAWINAMTSRYSLFKHQVV